MVKYSVQCFVRINIFISSHYYFSTCARMVLGNKDGVKLHRYRVNEGIVPGS